MIKDYLVELAVNGTIFLCGEYGWEFFVLGYECVNIVCIYKFGERDEREIIRKGIIK